MKDTIVIVGFVGLLATFMFMIHDARSFEIGGTGPEGGTITDIQSSDQVTGTNTEITADGYEVTTTTTETTTIIYENVDNEIVTTTTTTQTTEGVSSGDVINESACGTVTGSTLDHCAHVHMDYQGGTWDFQINLADYLDSTEWTDGFNINQSIYGYACTNQIGGDCNSGRLDPLTVTITVSDPISGETYQSAETFYLDQTWRYYESSMSIGENTLGSSTTIDLSYYGIDAGYWGGYYGPVLQYPELEIIDTQITTITQQITSIVTEQVLTTLTTYEDTVVRNYIGSTTTTSVADVTSDPTSPASPTSVVSSTPTISVNVSTPTATVSSFSMDASPMSMSPSSSDSGGGAQTADAGGSGGGSTESSSSSSSSNSGGGTKTASNSKSESKSDSKSDSKSESKSEESKSEGESSDEAKTEVANAIAQRIVADIASGTGDQAAALAAMASLGANLVDASLFDLANFYVGEDIYINKTIEDVYGVAFTYAQDKLMDKMVEQQYQ